MDSLDKLEKTTHEWFKMLDVYYRKFTMHKFTENLKKINFSNCHIAVAKNGGLMAFVKRTKHFIMDVNNPIKDSILVFFQNGLREVDPIPFDSEKNTIVLFEFTYDEDLILLLSDGKLYTFDIFSNKKMDYEFMGFSFEQNQIIDAKILDKGLIMLTEKGDFYLNYNVKDANSLTFFPARQYIPDFMYFNFNNNLGTNKDIRDKNFSFNPSNSVNKNIKDADFIASDFIVIPASVSASGKNELYFPHPKNGLYVYIEGEQKVKYMKKFYIQDFAPTKAGTGEQYVNGDLGKIVKLCASPSFEVVAFLNTDSQIFVFPSNMDVSDTNTSNTNLSLTYPFQLLWCGEDCVVANSQGLISLIGPDNFVKSIVTRQNCIIVSEVDGVRAITDEQVDFIQTVQEELYSTIFPLSIDSAKKLIDAYKVKFLHSH